MSAAPIDDHVDEEEEDCACHRLYDMPAYMHFADCPQAAISHVQTCTGENCKICCAGQENLAQVSAEIVAQAGPHASVSTPLRAIDGLICDHCDQFPCEDEPGVVIVREPAISTLNAATWRSKHDKLQEAVLVMSVLAVFLFGVFLGQHFR